MSPCGRTDGQTNKQTSENRATQSLDSVRLSFAIKITILISVLDVQKVTISMMVNMCYYLSISAINSDSNFSISIKIGYDKKNQNLFLNGS